MNIEASSIHASPVSQPDVPHVSAPPLDISHHVTEEFVPVPTPVDNAPPALDTATPARSGFLARLFGSNGPRQQEERYITDRRRAVGPDAVPASPSEEQRLLQLQINAEATEQRMVTFRMETEIAELDARKAAAEAALAQSHQRTHALERESADNLGVSPSPSLPAGTFPPWSELYAAMLHAYSLSYGAAGAYQDLHSLRRLPGSTGKEAYARVEEHSMLLRRKGVHNPGPEEQNAYILQNQLTAGESARWISLEKISDAALNALELGAADARTGRLSCPPPTREAFFAARREHLRNFLNEQGPATTGDRSLGSSSARAAVSTGNDTAELPTPPSGGAPTSSAPPVDQAAVVARLQAQYTARWSNTEHPPPRYYGTREHPELLRNTATFAERKASRACFGCTPTQLAAQGSIPHWECKHHGQDASDADRLRRVDGSGPARLSDGPGRPRRR